MRTNVRLEGESVCRILVVEKGAGAPSIGRNDHRDAAVRLHHHGNQESSGSERAGRARVSAADGHVQDRGRRWARRARPGKASGSGDLTVLRHLRQQLARVAACRQATTADRSHSFASNTRPAGLRPIHCSPQDQMAVKRADQTTDLQHPIGREREL